RLGRPQRAANNPGAARAASHTAAQFSQISPDNKRLTTSDAPSARATARETSIRSRMWNRGRMADLESDGAGPPVGRQGAGGSGATGGHGSRAARSHLSPIMA